MIGTAIPAVTALNAQPAMCLPTSTVPEAIPATSGIVTIELGRPLNQDVLWDNGLPNGLYALSSQYKPTPQSSLEVVADVNTSEPWVVTGGDFRIIINYVGGPEAITSVNFFVYKNQDDNTPSMVRYAERTATTFVGTYTGDNYFDMSEVLMNVTFDPITLTPGKWWICFQPVIDWETYWLASNLIGLGCYVSWPDYGYPKWTDDNDLPLIGEDIDVSFRLFGYIAGPPNTPTIEGLASGKINEPHDYIFNTTDPNGDDVYYYIDWGDNTTSGWIGPYPSGDEQTQSHTWLVQGTYTIRAKAKDIHGNESGWGTLSVTMPLSYEPPHFSFFAWLFERFPHAFPILRHLMGY